MVTKKVKARWPQFQKSLLASSDLHYVQYVRVYLIYTRLPKSDCLRIVDEGVRIHLGNTSQGQVKDQC